jgi:hypothetical protein
MKTIIFISILISSILSFCENKDNSENESDPAILKGSAIINRYGEEDEGDCGFFLTFNNSLYKPVNLDDNYKINSLRVFVKFELLGTVFLCGDIADPPYKRELGKIKILEIKKEE